MKKKPRKCRCRWLCSQYLQSSPSNFSAKIISKQIKCSIITTSENSESISGMAGWIKIVINSMMKRAHTHKQSETTNIYTSTKCTAHIHHFLWQYARFALKTERISRSFFGFDCACVRCRCFYFASSHYYDSIISCFVFNDFDVVAFLSYDE